MGLTASLGGFIADLQPEHVPADARHTVRRGITDCWGVLFAGRDEPVVGHALATVTMAAHGQARVLADRGLASAADAAFVNATAAHALDYDDTGLDGHPSVVLAPAVLAEGERIGARWIDIETAYIVGYEVWAELIARDTDKHHGKGWHPTAVFGCVAAAAAAARLRRLDATRAARALGIASSMAAGLVANFGSMTKPLQVGWAVRNGLLAAALAERGVSAAPDALESPRGLLAALSPAGRVRLDGECRPGAPWQILRQGISIKRYPVCYALHRAVDATLALRAQFDAQAQDIVTIQASIGRLQAAMLRSSRPRTGLDAKFSAEYALACALLHGRLGLAELRDDAVNQPAVQALLCRVQVEALDEQDADEPLFAPADRVRVQLADGRWLAADPVHRALGHASRPIDDAALHAKFSDCGGPEAWWTVLMHGDALAVPCWPRSPGDGDQAAVGE